jgi:hypothetical protein
MPDLRQGTAVEITIGPYSDNIDGFTRETALSIPASAIMLKKGAADWAAKNEGTAAAHEFQGNYRCLLNATDVNTLGMLEVDAPVTGAIAPSRTFNVITAVAWDAKYASGNTPAQVKGLDANVITTAAWADGALTNAKVAADLRAGIASATWNALRSAHNAAGSFGESIRLAAAGLLSDAVDAVQSGLATDADLTTIGGIVLSLDGRIPNALHDGQMVVSRRLAAGTADAGTTTTIVDSDRSEADVDFWKGMQIIVYKSGELPKGQVRLVTGFNPGTDTITFTPPLTFPAAFGTVYELIPWSAANVGQLEVGSIPVGAYQAGAITAAAVDAAVATKIRAVASGQAESGTTTTMVDNARTETNVDYWKGSVIVFVNGPNVGLSRKITGFDPATDTITFKPALPVGVGTDLYEIWPSGEGVDVTVGVGGFPVGGFVDNSITENAHATNAFSSRVFANGFFTSSKWSGQAITAAVTSADFVTEIQSGLITSGALAAVASDITAILARLPTSLVSGRIKAFVEAMDTNVMTSDAMATSMATEIAAAVGGGGGGGADAETVAAAVWNTLRVGHQVPGTFGEGVASVQGAVASVAGSVGGTVAGIRDGGITALSYTSAALNAAADALLRRHYGSARVSPNGDSVDDRSVLGLLSGAVNRFQTIGNQFRTFHEDDTTVFMTRTLTPAPGSDPVSGADTD